MRKEKIAQSFGNNCSYYDAHANVQKQVAEKLVSLLPNITAPKILEIGCGTGFLTKLLFQKYPDGNFHITDLSSDMLAHCQKQAPNTQARYFQMDAEKPHCDSDYDLVVSAMTFQWFENPIETLQELSQKGDVYYSALGGNNFKEWKNILKKNDLQEGTLPPIHWPNLIDEDDIQENHENGKDFLKMLKQTGTATPSAQYKQLDYIPFKRVLSAFDGTITWHIVYGFEPRKHPIISA